MKDKAQIFNRVNFEPQIRQALLSELRSKVEEQIEFCWACQDCPEASITKEDVLQIITDLSKESE